MKIKSALVHAVKERSLVLPWLLLVLLTFVMSIIFAIRIHPSELTLPVRYTAYGFTFIYNDAWYYLVVFVLFGFVVLGVHTLITLKLFSQKGVELARLFLFLTIALAVISFFLINAVLGLAELPQ